MDVVDNNPVVPANTVSPQTNLTPETPKTPEPTQKKKTPRKIVTIGLIIILIFVAILLTLLAFTYLERNRYGSATINNKNTTDSNIVSSPVSYTADKNKEFSFETFNIRFTYDELEMGTAYIIGETNPDYLLGKKVSIGFKNFKILSLDFNPYPMGYSVDPDSKVQKSEYVLSTKDGKEFSVSILNETLTTGKKQVTFLAFYKSNNAVLSTFYSLNDVKEFGDMDSSIRNFNNIIKSLSFDLNGLNEDQSVSGSETKTFQSTRYDVTFNYPSSMGEYSVEYLPDYFNDEKIAFSNSIIELHYWRFEGSTGGTYEEQIIQTKDGKICSVKTFGASIMASCPGDITIYTAGTFSGSDSNTVKAYQDDIRTIITSLEYTR